MNEYVPGLLTARSTFHIFSQRGSHWPSRSKHVFPHVVPIVIWIFNMVIVNLKIKWLMNLERGGYFDSWTENIWYFSANFRRNQKTILRNVLDKQMLGLNGKIFWEARNVIIGCLSRNIYVHESACVSWVDCLEPMLALFKETGTIFATLGWKLLLKNNV